MNHEKKVVFLRTTTKEVSSRMNREENVFLKESRKCDFCDESRKNAGIPYRDPYMDFRGENTSF